MKQVNLLNQEELTAYRNFLLEYCEPAESNGIQIHYCNQDGCYSFTLAECAEDEKQGKESPEYYVDYLLTEIKKDGKVNLLIWRTVLDELGDQLETNFEKPISQEELFG